MTSLPHVLAIVGPTSSGKSRVGLELAERFGGEIVSADSRQIYRGMDVGTAKPTAEEQTRIPHHLIDTREPTDEYSVAEYQTDATEAITDIVERGKLPMLVGGTGLYVKAVLEDLQIPLVPPNPERRAELELLSNQELIAHLDAKTAAQVDTSNPRRLVRAVEVFEATGRGLADHRSSSQVRYNTLKLGLKPVDLSERIERAVRQRFADGVIGEAIKLHESGMPNKLLTERVIAYGPALDAAAGKISEDEAIAEAMKLDRAYAKRQLTWFKRDPNIIWLENPTDATALVEQWLPKGLTAGEQLERYAR